MMMMPVKMIILCVLSISCCLSAAIATSTNPGKGNDEFFDYAANDHSSKNLPQKRYTYVSEYKRLPVYNFGIGKRARPYEFGVGRRSAYQFGLGKRFNFDDQPLDYVSETAHDSIPRYFGDDQSQYKRGPSKQFSFGVGKRASDSVSSVPEYLISNFEKQKNNAHDSDLYDVYELMRKLNKENKLS